MSVARRSRRSHVAMSSRYSDDSRAIWPARRGSSHAPGFVSSASSSSARLALAGRSKVLLELQDAVQDLFRGQFSVHLSAVAPLVLLTRPAPARIVAPDFMGWPAGARRGPHGHRGSPRGRGPSLLRGLRATSRAVGAVRL